MDNQIKKIGDKRGISLMVGYILLVVFAVIIGTIVFGWLQTFVPAENIQCPDGTSLLVTNPSFDAGISQFTITLKNTGRFNLAGYFIQVSNESDAELPTIGLSEYVTSGGTTSGSSILFGGSSDNPFQPGEQETHTFSLPDSIGEEIYLVSVTPARHQEVEGINRFVSCSGSRVELPVNLLTGSTVFVSSETYASDIGLSGADAECNSMASDEGLNGTYVAWMSTDSTDAADRITDNFYVLVNETRIANSKEDLLDGNLSSPINIDQTGFTRSGRTWTGTDTSGVSTGIDCDNWSTVSAGSDATRGDPDASDSGWTDFEDVACNDESRIYCFQTE